MSVVVNVAGATPIYVGAVGASFGSLGLLGYTRNGSQITEQVFWEDVPGDENGGDAGPPVEVQYMGEVDIIRLLLTKWDPTVGATIRARLNGGTAGTPATAGTLVFTGGSTAGGGVGGGTAGTSNGFRLLLNSATDPRNYVCAVPREPQEMNKGSKFSEWSVTFTAYKVPGQSVIYNASTS